MTTTITFMDLNCCLYKKSIKFVIQTIPPVKHH